MKKNYILIFIIFAINTITAIEVSGNQSGIWNAENNPYIIVGDIIVPENDSLIINPGVDVIGNNGYKITVQGNVQAIGTVEDSIYFHAQENEIWGGFRLENESLTSNFLHCIIENTNDDNDNAINSINSPVNINNCRFTYHDCAINVFSIGNNNPPQVNIINTIITDCVKSGISINENRNTLIDSCEITRCGSGNQYRGAIQISSQTSNMPVEPIIQNSYIHNNYKQGIISTDIFGVGGINPLIQNCIITENLTGIYFYNTTGRINNCEITNNFIEGNSNSGAGIMLNMAGGDCIVTNTLISGNYTGIYAINHSSCNLGNIENQSTDDDGLNTIINNIDPTGTTYSLYCNTDGNLYAQNCFWGTEDIEEIQQTIIDGNDSSGTSVVSYLPLASEQELNSISGTVSFVSDLDINTLTVSLVETETGCTKFSQETIDGNFSFQFEENGTYFIIATALLDDESTKYGAYPSLGNEISVSVTNGESIQNVDFELEENTPKLQIEVTQNYVENEMNIYELVERFWVLNKKILKLNFIDENQIKFYSITIYNEENNSWEETIFNDETFVINQSDEWNSFLFINNDFLTAIPNMREFNYVYDGIGYEPFIVDYFSEGSRYSSMWFAENLGIVKIKNFTPYDGCISYYELENFVSTDRTNYFPLTIGNRWIYKLTNLPNHPSDLSITEIENQYKLEWDDIYHNTTNANWVGYRIYTPENTFDVDITTTSFILNDYIAGDYYVVAYNNNYESEPTNTVTLEEVSNNDDIDQPSKLTAYNYPNPFNPKTFINFTLPEETDVKLEIYNMLGQKINTLINSHLEKGNYQVQWNGKDLVGNEVSSNIYFYKIKTTKEKIIKKMILLK